MIESGLLSPGNSTPLKLIVGIGNPGKEYSNTRHNVGVWFLDELVQRYGVSLRSEKKFHGRHASLNIVNREVRLLVPDTYMNESGKSVSALANFFKLF